MCAKSFDHDQLSQVKKYLLLLMYLVWIVMAIVNAFDLVPLANKRDVIKITVVVWFIIVLFWMYIDAKIHDIRFRGWHHPVIISCLPISFWFYGFKSRGVLGGLIFLITSSAIATSMLFLSVILSFMINRIFIS